MNEIISRFRKRSDDGITLMELVVGVFIMGLVSLLVFNIFIATSNTGNTVQTSQQSISETQIATSMLSKDVRNGVAFQVDNTGNRLDVESADGTCATWIYADGSLYKHTSEAGNGELDPTTWFNSFSYASLGDATSFFTPLGDTGVRYEFQLGKDTGAISMSGDIYQRVIPKDSSHCFEPGALSDPSEENEEPEDNTPPAPVYTITYDLAGGSASGNPVQYYATTTTFTLIKPTRAGYAFAGWTGTGLSVPTMNVTINQGSTGNKAFTATWVTTPSYTITYDLAGGNVSGNPTSFTALSDSFTLINPTRDGYTFAGWTGSGLSSPAMTMTISSGSTGNRNYTATWTASASQFTVIWDQTGGYNGVVQGNFSFKNNSNSSVSRITFVVKITGATAVSGNIDCSSLGNSTFSCVTPSYGSVGAGSKSSGFWTKIEGNYSGNASPIVTIISATKHS